MRNLHSFRLMLTVTAFTASIHFVSAQNVGIDQPLPLQKLDVAGGIRIGSTPVGLLGSLRMNGTVLEYHNGTAWVQMSANTDDQQVDLFSISSNTLSLSLENDGQPPLTVNLAPYLDNTDDQVIDFFNLNANVLSISLENDGQPAQTVNLAAYLDNTDDQQVDLFSISANTLSLSLESDGQAPLTVNLAPYLDNTDDQQITNFSIASNTLSLELENDGQPAQTVNLAPYLDNTDDQTVDVFSLTGTNLNLSLESDGQSTLQVNLDPLRRSLVDADADTKVEVEATADEDAIRFTTAASERMRILSNGKVGIGTTTPGTKLTVYGTQSDTEPVLSVTGGNQQSIFNNGAQIAFGFDGDNEYQHFIHTRHNQIAAANNSIDFYVNSGTTANNTVTSGSTHVMSLNAGNVGIGVTSPAQKLHVSGTGRFSALSGGGSQAVITDNNGDLIAVSSLVGTGVGDNLGNHTATTTLNMSNNEVDNINYLDMRAGNGYGIRFWSSNSYAIAMGNAAEYQYGPVTDYSIKNHMSNDAGRGWTWGIDGATPVAAINNTGNMQLAGDMTVVGNIYGRSVNNSYSNLYRMGGVYFTWDSDTYGTNNEHSIRSTYGDSYGDNITVNSYNHIRFNLDANNNNPTSYFELGDNTTSTTNIIFRIETGGDISLNGKHAFRSNDAWLRLNQNGAFTSGTYTPGFLRVDGGITSGNSTSPGAGQIRATGLSGGGTRVVTVDNNGTLVANASLVGTGLGDNLGNHSATTTLQLNNNLVTEVAELRFNDDVRFMDEGNNNYVRLRYGNTGAGGIVVYDGNDARQGYLYSAGDQNSFGLLDADGTWAVRIDNNDYVELLDNNEAMFRAGAGGVGGNYGSVVTLGNGKGDWEGYSINDRYVFMSDDNNTVGIYNDVNNRWIMQHERGSWTRFYEPDAADYIEINANTDMNFRDNNILDVNDIEVNRIYDPEDTEVQIVDDLRMLDNDIWDVNVMSVNTIYSEDDLGDATGDYTLTIDDDLRVNITSNGSAQDFYVRGDDSRTTLRTQTTNHGQLGRLQNYWLRTYTNQIYRNSELGLSDRRVKENITSLDSKIALNQIMSLRGVKYDLAKNHPFYPPSDSEYDKITEKSLYDNLGFIAQELQEVIPEMVVEDDNCGYLTVINYEQLFPVIIEAMKEQQSQIENLKKVNSDRSTVEIQQLKTEIESLKLMVKQLSEERK